MSKEGCFLLVSLSCVKISKVKIQCGDKGNVLFPHIAFGLFFYALVLQTLRSFHNDMRILGALP